MIAQRSACGSDGPPVDYLRRHFEVGQFDRRRVAIEPVDPGVAPMIGVGKARLVEFNPRRERCLEALARGVAVAENRMAARISPEFIGHDKAPIATSQHDRLVLHGIVLTLLH